MRSLIPPFVEAVKSVLRDVALIVISILIAFTLDAWWANQKQRSDLRDALVAVHEDFLATRMELDHVLAENRRYAIGVNTLLQMDEKGLSALKDDSVEALAGLLPTGGLTFDPTTGAVDALISGGDLHLIDDVDLRSAIAAWPSVMDELAEDLDILINMYLAQQERSVQLSIYLRARRATLSDSQPEAAREIIRAVMADVEMLNRLAAHAVAIEGLEDELNEARRTLNSILYLLPEES